MKPTYVTLKAGGTLAHETLTQQVPSLETNECIFTMLRSLGIEGLKLQEFGMRSGQSSLHRTALKEGNPYSLGPTI